MVISVAEGHTFARASGCVDSQLQRGQKRGSRDVALGQLVRSRCSFPHRFTVDGSLILIIWNFPSNPYRTPDNLVIVTRREYADQIISYNPRAHTAPNDEDSIYVHEYVQTILLPFKSETLPISQNHGTLEILMQVWHRPSCVQNLPEIRTSYPGTLRLATTSQPS